MNTYNEKDMEKTAKDKLDQYSANAETAIRQGESKLKETAADLERRLKQGQDQIKNAYNSVDKQLHQNPWPVVSAVAVGCLFLGFLMGSRRND